MRRWLRAFNYSPLWRGYVCFDGQYVFHPSLDRWLYLVLNRWGLMGAVERSVIHHLVRPGMHVLDVGANLGLYSVYFRQCVGEVGTVTAMEPVPELRQAMEKGLKKNSTPNVTVLPFAAGAKEGSALLTRNSLNSGDNAIEMNPPKAGPLALSVPLRRIDCLGLDPLPDFVKIDVQGGELEVLRGMSQWFEAGHKPLLFCEISEKDLRQANASPEILGEALCDYGYEIYLPELKNGKLEFQPMTFEALKEKAGRTLYFDVVACPKDKAAAMLLSRDEA